MVWRLSLAAFFFWLSGEETAPSNYRWMYFIGGLTQLLWALSS